MNQTLGLVSAPVTRALICYTFLSALLVSIANQKLSMPLQLTPHIWPQLQLYRLLVWQTSFSSSSEVLLGILLLYHMRHVERALGTRKFAAFVLLSILYTSFLGPAVLLLAGILTFSRFNVLPSGPFAIIFAELFLYYRLIPAGLTWQISQPSGDGPLFSDKLPVYIFALLLALSRPLGSAACALIGLITGYGWLYEALPRSNWRPSRVSVRQTPHETFRR